MHMHTCISMVPAGAGEGPGSGGRMLLHFDELGKVKVAPPDGHDKIFEKSNGYFEREADE